MTFSFSFVMILSCVTIDRHAVGPGNKRCLQPIGISGADRRRARVGQTDARPSLRPRLDRSVRASVFLLQFHSDRQIRTVFRTNRPYARDGATVFRNVSNTTVESRVLCR